MVKKVCKFGGTSLATREQIEKSIDIMLADDSRRYMIVSAPGAAYNGDKKITDLLIRSTEEYRISKKSPSADVVIAKFNDIIPGDAELVGRLWTNLQSRLSDTRAKNYVDGIKAFGEYANAVVINTILQGKGIASEFFDPQELAFTLIGEGNNIRPDSRCYNKVGAILETKIGGLQLAVIPGFYAYNRKGELITLPRGGSDVSGAVIARAVNAEIYENWTDENGLKRADPRIIENAETIPEMTYIEARELAYMGFKLQDACFEPIVNRGITLNVKNTNNPKHPGTFVVDERDVSPEEYIVGVACEGDHICIGMRKMYSDQEVGLGRKLFQVFEDRKMPYEHHPNGVDSLSVVLRGRYLQGDNNLDNILNDILEKCGVERKISTRKLSLLSVAGLGMSNHVDAHSKVFSALAKERIYSRTIDEGADDISMFVGVDENRAGDAVRAVYDEFFGKK
jgi:aspartate kinase